MLSIIIPAHNEEENIIDIVNKLENFIDIPFELVIVNDHSTDNTGKSLENLSRQYNNIRVFENTQKIGALLMP